MERQNLPEELRHSLGSELASFARVKEHRLAVGLFLCVWTAAQPCHQNRKLSNIWVFPDVIKKLWRKFYIIGDTCTLASKHLSQELLYILKKKKTKTENVYLKSSCPMTFSYALLNGVGWDFPSAVAGLQLSRWTSQCCSKRTSGSAGWSLCLCAWQSVGSWGSFSALLWGWITGRKFGCCCSGLYCFL